MKPLCDCGKELHKVLENYSMAVYVCLYCKKVYKVDQKNKTIKEVENGQ